MNDMTREFAILEQAAEWFAILGDESTTDEEWRRWQNWLAADAAHAQAWQRVEAIGQPFLRIAAVDAEAVRGTLASAQRLGRRRMLHALGLGGIMIGAAMLLRRNLPWQNWAHDFSVARAAQRTRVGERRQLVLDDGTRLAINTASAVDVVFDNQFRRIVLHEGEVLVDSAPDSRVPARPLIVDTPCGRFTALGTRFSVRTDLQRGQLTVFDGTVRVALARSARTSDVLAGEQIRFTPDRSEAAGRADAAREGWSRGLLIADNIALRAFVDELVRYTDVPIQLDPASAPLRLVGVYSIANPPRDVPQILAALEIALPVRIAHSQNGGLAIVPR